MPRLLDQGGVDSFLHSFHCQKSTMSLFFWQDADRFQYLFSGQEKKLLGSFVNGKLSCKRAIQPVGKTSFGEKRCFDDPIIVKEKNIFMVSPHFLLFCCLSKVVLLLAIGGSRTREGKFFLQPSFQAESLQIGEWGTSSQIFV
jgi:hypothetical protein